MIPSGAQLQDISSHFHGSNGNGSPRSCTKWGSETMGPSHFSKGLWNVVSPWNETWKFHRFLAILVFLTRERGVCIALSLCNTTEIVSFLPFSSPNPLGGKSRSWKCHCANKRFRITLVRTLTYLDQEPTEKGSLCLGNRHGPGIAPPVWKAQAEISTSYLKKWWKAVFPALPWFCVLGKIPKGTVVYVEGNLKSSL